MILSVSLPAARLARKAALVPLLLILWLVPLHARACEGGALCADYIDAFFMPLIASSLTEEAAAVAAAPVADIPAMALPDEPAIIKPPPRTSPPPRTGHTRLAGQGGTATGHGSVDGWRACKTSYTDRYGSPAKTVSRRCKSRRAATRIAGTSSRS